MRTNGRSGAKPRAGEAGRDGGRALRHVDDDGAGHGVEARAASSATAVAASRATSGPSCVRGAARAREQVAGAVRGEQTTGAGRAARSARIALRSAPKAAASSSRTRAAPPPARPRRRRQPRRPAPAHQVRSTGRNPMRPVDARRRPASRRARARSPASVSAAVARSTSRVARPSRR